MAFESRGLAGEPNKGIASLSDQALEKLALAKIYFGHQSVGSNIMEGVNDLMGQDPRLKLKIEETVTPSTFQGGVFSHGPVGKNENPASKIDDFADKINAGVGGRADIAFFKFCYIDVMADRNIDEIFSRYQKTMGGAEKILSADHVHPCHRPVDDRPDRAEGVHQKNDRTCPRRLPG